MVQGEKCAKHRQITELNRRILRKAPCQIGRDGLGPPGIPRDGQCNGSAILHLPVPGKLECLCRPPPCGRRIPEKSFPQCWSSIEQSSPFPVGRLLSQVHRTLCFFSCLLHLTGICQDQSLLVG